jgi:hypothetical protein
LTFPEGTKMKKLFKYFGYGALSLVIVGVLFAANLVLQPYDKIRIYLSLGPILSDN